MVISTDLNDIGPIFGDELRITPEVLLVKHTCLLLSFSASPTVI